MSILSKLIGAFQSDSGAFVGADPAAIQLLVKGAASQTAKVLAVQDSAGSELFSLTAAGIGAFVNTFNGVFGASTTPVIGTLVTGTGGFDQFRLYPDGAMEFGPGSGARDTKLVRLTANAMSLLTADFLIGTVGRGLRIAVGTNGKMNTATLVAGTVTISNTSVTANSHIIVYHMTQAGTPGWLRVSAKTAGTSFVVTSSSSTDTSLIGYQIVEPA